MKWRTSFIERINDNKDSDISVKFNGKLRDYQTKIVNKCYKHMKKKYGGILSVPCGRGKTVMAINLFTKLKKKTLVIVHKEFLMNQWIERIKQFCDKSVSIGIIQGKKIDVDDKDIVIFMLQSLSMKKYNINLEKL